MTKHLQKYIEENQVCSELLFRDWRTFLEILFAEGECVKSILWYEYVQVSKQEESLGGGGYYDRQNPDHMWAETMLFEDGFEDKSVPQIIGYIEKIIAAYPGHDLIPSFFID